MMEHTKHKYNCYWYLTYAVKEQKKKTHNLYPFRSIRPVYINILNLNMFSAESLGIVMSYSILDMHMY